MTSSNSRASTPMALLKIDAEGASLPLLRSFPFDKFRPEVIMTEFMDERGVPPFGYMYYDVVQSMKERDYSAYVAQMSSYRGVSSASHSGFGKPGLFARVLPRDLTELLVDIDSRPE